MLIYAKILALALGILVASWVKPPLANAGNSVVLLIHSNNTGFEGLEIGNHIDKSFLARIIEGKKFVVRYRYPIKESLRAEEDLKVTKGEFKAAVMSKDFENTFNMLENDISDKEENGNLPADLTGKIGRLHNADYLLHCTIDGIAEGSDSYSLNTKMGPLEALIPNLNFIASFRLVRAKDGKVVWLERETSVARDYKLMFKGVSLENKSSIEALLINCARKVTEKASKHLDEALTNREVVLK